MRRTEAHRIQKVEIVTGFSCNNNCRFCSIGERSFDKSTETLKRDVERAARITRKEINFTGGEPTIRKDIFELVEFASSFKFEDVRVTTNGRMFSYKSFARKMLTSGLTGAIFSIHAPTPSVHDYLTRVDGSFVQAMKGWKNLRNLGCEIDNNVVLTSRNYMLLPELAEYLSKNGLRAMCIIYPTIDGNLLKNPELIPEFGRVAPFVHKTIDILKKHKKTVWCLNIPLCFMQGYEKYSELMELKTRMIWPNEETDLDEKRMEGRKKVDACNECRFRLICAGIPERYLNLKGNGNVKPIKGRLITAASEVYG